MDLQQAKQAVRPVSRESREAAQERMAQRAIPLGSLGWLEEAILRLAAIQGTVLPVIDKRAVVVFCADNGVVAQGVTQCGQEVTAVVAENMARGKSAVCLMAKHLGMDVFPVDIGMAQDVKQEKLIQRKVRYGTADLTEEPAMTREEAVQAIEVGIEMAEARAREGYQVLCAGEMGIGNTTTSAAIAAAMLDTDAAKVTGRGAGLSLEGLERKIAVVSAALERHQPDRKDPLDVLSKVGGLDIAGMAGLYIGGAACGLPVLMDGVISNAAAVIAAGLCPAAQDYMIATGMSPEPASMSLLAAVGLRPVFAAGMRLGEGTGGVAATALLELALTVYRDMPGFDEIGIEAYQPLT